MAEKKLPRVSRSLNPFMQSGFFYRKSLDRSISNRRGVWLPFIITNIYKMPALSANSVDPNQTPQRLIWVFTVCQCPFNGMPDLNGLNINDLFWL